MLHKTRGLFIQPIETTFEASADKTTALDLSQFLTLLRSEEDYYRDQVHDTKTILSHLRKIFYDIYGWNKQLIRGAAHISNRYQVTLVADEKATYPNKLYALVKRSGSDMQAAQVKREVLVRPNDWMNPNAGTVPTIYANDNQESILPDGLYCDLGHVLAGMDATNYPEVVAPLPDQLMFLSFLVPHVHNNAFCATWLGDIASSSGEMLFQSLQLKRRLEPTELQALINAFAPGTDMLGNIDSIVIPSVCQLNTHKGERISDILESYYCEGGKYYVFMQKRYSIFCKQIGLLGWDGASFSNEKKWLRKYKRQLRCTTAFYAFTRSEKPRSYFTALKIWLRLYEKHLYLDDLLVAFLLALKENIKKEL